MLKTIFDKLLENVVGLAFSGVVLVAGCLIRKNEAICSSVVSWLAYYPRAAILGMAVVALGVVLAIYLLGNRIVELNAKCLMMAGKIKSIEGPMRNLELEGCSSIYRDTEQDRFICPKCFAEKKIRSYLERVASDEYSYEAYTYECHVCGFKICDITGLDKYAASAKAQRVEANRNALCSDGGFGCI